jgi:hypothetical protein
VAAISFSRHADVGNFIDDLRQTVCQGRVNLISMYMFSHVDYVRKILGVCRDHRGIEAVDRNDLEKNMADIVVVRISVE